MKKERPRKCSDVFLLVKVAKLCYVSWHKRCSIDAREKLMADLERKDERTADDRKYRRKQQFFGSEKCK